MDTNLILIIAGVAVLAIVLLLVLTRGRKPILPGEERDGVGDAGAAAIGDVVDELLGVDSHPAMPEAAGPPDDLTRIKGLGPKAAALLNGHGITRYDQLAALDQAQATSLDARMEAFKGRLERDRWQEQAGHLASGDTAGFEEKFGKLG